MSVTPQGRDRVCVCHRRFDTAQRELARATAIGVSLKLRRQVLEEAEALCGTVANMNKVRRHDCSCACVQSLLSRDVRALGENA